MHASPKCPSCNKDGWVVGRTYSYPRELSGGLSPYDALRRRILLELWDPTSDPVKLRLAVCASCGLVTYLPRPSAEDLEKKYRFLQEHEPQIGGSSETSLGRSLDERRSERIFRSVASLAPQSQRSVLDFGGGNGKLLAPFVARGDECAVVDFAKTTVPGVSRIGETIADLPPSAHFDVIICSHVLEHLAAPGDVVKMLATHLAPRGVLYAEVPVEVWKGIPIASDPVTHVNFFVPSSFEALFRRNGMEVIESWDGPGTYGEAAMRVATVLAVAGTSTRSGIAPGQQGGDIDQGVVEAVRAISPGVAEIGSHFLQSLRIAASEVGARARQVDSASSAAMLGALLVRRALARSGVQRAHARRPSPTR